MRLGKSKEVVGIGDWAEKRKHQKKKDIYSVMMSQICNYPYGQPRC